jgi:hypothetical protein
MYEYYCNDNDVCLEVIHGFKEKIETWGQLCQLAGAPLGETPAETPVTRLISAPSLAFPKTSSELKDMGFTKLVRREKGVYENVTAREGESRYMSADNPASVPDVKRTISD